ncbi:MAG TPA: hypothetical protein H9829_00575 [Candidatus Tetragenococcus pullicola]|nr:hypothetical protein [Candidatus Tetragenococcus pullicola]
MRNKKAFVSVLMCTALLLAACGSGKGDDKEAAKPAEKDSSGKWSDITITTAKQLDENAGKYDKGDDINNNPMISLGEEKKGIKIDTILLGGDADNYTTKLRLALTGSEELPDVFPVYDTQMAADMIESGRAKAIDEDIEKYMPERLKEIYDQYPETFYPVTQDGKTYGIANTPALDDGEVLIIRQDWLDKLELKAPTNMAEFETVIKAFTEDDPDGNGKKDTYGFTYGGSDIYNTGWVADPVMLFSANSGKMFPGTWQEDENGELQYGSIDEGNKKTLEKMAEWHKSGYLFKEAAATGAWDAMTEFTEGKAGIFMARPWAIDSVNDLIVNNPDAKIGVYPTINQENGDPTFQGASTNDGWLMFNSDFNNMEAFFDYYDWLYDIAFSTGDFNYGYLEGYDYDIVDGEPVFDSTKFDPPVEDQFAPDKALLTKNRPFVERMQPYHDIVNGKDPETGDELKAVSKLEQNKPVVDGYAIAYENIDQMLPPLFNGAPTETMTKSWEQLQTMEKETYTNIIYGKQDISAFDDYVAKWKSQGGDQITEEVNEWYKEVNK